MHIGDKRDELSTVHRRGGGRAYIQKRWLFWLTKSVVSKMPIMSAIKMYLRFAHRKIQYKLLFVFGILYKSHSA